MEYIYRRDDKTLIDVRNRISGVGDIKLGFLYQAADIKDCNRKNVQCNGKLRFPKSVRPLIRLGLSLPTGDEQDLTSSGAVGASLTIGLSQSSTPIADQLGWFLTAGAVFYDNSGLLSDYRKDILWHSQLGASWRWSETLTFKSQIETQSGLFESTLSSLSNRSTQLLSLIHI